MPAPQASMMQQLARLKFAGNALQVPDKWQQPSNQDHYGQAFSDSEKATAPDTTVPPLFNPVSLNKYHTDTQKKLNKDIGDFLDKTCSAICSAWSQWQSTATLATVVIAGPVATGGIVAPIPLTPLIIANGAVNTPSLAKYTKTIATVIGTTWLQYTATMKVPGLPWYPTFLMLPMPVAPPTPNIPCPVVTIAPGGAAMMMAQSLSSQMFGQHGDPQAQYARQIFDAVADAFNKCFMIWQTSTMVTNVIPTGGVPTFAPPYVPAGPVVGMGNMTPGGFA